MIRLRKFQASDGQRLIDWAISPNFLLHWAGPLFTYPLTEQQIQNYRSDAEGPNPTRMIFSAYRVENNETIGHIELNNIDRVNLSATVSRVLIAPEHRGQGLASDMMREVLEIGFAKLGLHRIDLFVFETNHAAIRSYEKFGFIHEGTQRESRYLEGQFYNVIQMSLLQKEWVALFNEPPLRAR